MTKTAPEKHESAPTSETSEPAAPIDPSSASPSDPASLEADVAESAQQIAQAPVTPQPPEEPAESRSADDYDSAGDLFDPERHLRKRRKNGQWVKKPSGRPSKAGRKRAGASRPDPQTMPHSSGGPQLGPDPRQAPPPGGGPAGPSGSEPGPGADLYRSNAQATVASLLGVGVMLGGAEWVAAKEEREQMVEAWTAYYAARGVPDLPPEVNLAMVMLAYAGPRLRQPQTSSRLKATFGRVRDWWATRGAETVREKEARRAQADHRANGERQEHAAQANDAGLPQSRSAVSSVLDGIGS